MTLRWASSAQADLARLYEFLAPLHPPAAARAVRQIIAAANRLPVQPRLGVRLHEFGDREVRRIVIGDYEVRYEIASNDLYILRVFHTREDR